MSIIGIMRIMRRRSKETLRIGRAAVVGLPVAWAVHDAEEVLTAAAWSRKAPDLIRRRFPDAPAWLIRNVRVTTGQMGVAVSIVGVAIVSATRPALRARDPQFGSFRVALAGYSLHGLAHIGQSVALRAYTPGLVTTPAFVLGYSAYAWKSLRDAGLAQWRDVLRAGSLSLLVLPVLGLGAQAVGRVSTSEPIPTGGAVAPAKISSISRLLGLLDGRTLRDLREAARRDR
jgi:hypothetical protein